MPHFMTILILYINLLNLSWIKKCLFLRNMEPLNEIATLNVSVLPTQLMIADNFCWLKTFLVEAYKNYKN